MLGKNIFYALIGFAFAVSLSPILALTVTEKNQITDEQMYALKYTGMYQPVYNKPVQIYTYETLCRGFYTVENTGAQIKYTGFGDLAEKYTYTISLPVVDSLQATNTSPLDEKIIPSIPDNPISTTTIIGN